MVKAKHSHNAVGEVKAKILELILESTGPVAEPDIRKKIQIEYEGLTQATVNRHLNDLLANGCLELIPPSKGTTRANSWNVSNLGKLVKIKDQYKSIQLNKYPKSLNLILKEMDCNIDSPNGRLIKAQLQYSNSFFSLNLDKNISYLNSKSAEISRFEANICTSKNPIDDEEYNSLLSDIFTYFVNNSFEVLPHVEVSKDKFKEIIGSQLSFLDIENPEKLKVEEINREVIKELSKLLSENVPDTVLMDGEIDQLPPIMSPKIERDLKNNLSADIMKLILNDGEIYTKIIDLQKLEQIKRISRANTVFNHCVRTDILDDNFTEEEKKFVYGAQKATSEFISGLKNNAVDAVKKYNVFLEEF